LRNFSMCGSKFILQKRNPPASDNSPAGGMKSDS
jgi:hypothetical protein